MKHSQPTPTNLTNTGSVGESARQAFDPHKTTIAAIPVPAPGSIGANYTRMRTRMRLDIRLCASLAILLASGCVDALEKTCQECPPAHDVYHCATPGFGNNRICARDDVHAAGLCPEGAALVYECSDYGTGGIADEGSGKNAPEQAPGWEPALHVRHDTSTGIYFVDAELIDQVAAHPYALIAQEEARLSELPNGFFRLTRVERDGLAYALGLRNLDTIRSINDRPLRTLDDYLNAAVSLRSINELALKVERARQLILLQYRIE